MGLLFIMVHDIHCVITRDGAMNDSRLAVALAMTSASSGATVVNHVQVVKLNKKSVNGIDTLVGATVRDTLTNEEWDVKAKVHSMFSF